ncbi:MAG: Histidine-tRNA ligase [candidate division TM6 bacterium GW2011_GWF2_43_17]|nr:MAG: Histidine-tRNA ligase [candidate division TM6 bacterium GW2011_GWF2_43_17]HAU30106.1 histidine--tRNA ligase [Candidatus Dependentiae bacterium]
MFRRVKGTQDFLDLGGFLQVIDGIRKHLACYNFTPVETPILEHAELFSRSLGEHTDVVHKEMFFVANRDDEDGGKEALVLRPEMTASVMRAFFEAQHELAARPWRAFTWGPAFRYERPQKGRYRQFHQVSLEIIDAASVAYDAELIALLYQFFSTTLTLENFVLEVNYLGSLEDRARYKKALLDYLDGFSSLPQALVDRKIVNILRCFDLKDEASQQVMRDAPQLLDFLSGNSLVEWEQIQRLLEDLAIPFMINPRLVRGLDYYNKTVFEFSSSLLGAQSAFCGGGRYDLLAQEFGAKEAIPSLGAGIGIERLVLLLEEEGKIAPRKKPSCVVVPLSEDELELSLLYAEKIRSFDCSCEAIFDIKSVKSMMRRANKHAAKFALLIGTDERLGNYITAKDMDSGEECRIAPVDLEKFCRNI